MRLPGDTTMFIRILIIFTLLLSGFTFIKADTTTDIPLRSKQLPVRFRGTKAITLGYRPQYRQRPDESALGEPAITYFRLNDIIFTMDFSYDFIFPLPMSDHPLFKMNNLTLNLNTRISAATMLYGSELKFTPVAFYEIAAGFNIGTGWAIKGMGNPLAVNYEGEMPDQYFIGAVISTYLKQSLQFDFAYLMPERARRWGHIIMQATFTIFYRALLSVPDDQPYRWGDDDGVIMNGWHINSRLILGYSIPILEEPLDRSRTFLKLRNKTVSILLGGFIEVNDLNVTHYADSIMADGGWGSDFVPLLFGPLLRLQLPHNVSINILGQFSNDRLFTTDSYTSEDYYQDRAYQGYYVYPRRLLCYFGWNF